MPTPEEIAAKYRNIAAQNSQPQQQKQSQGLSVSPSEQAIAEKYKALAQQQTHPSVQKKPEGSFVAEAVREGWAGFSGMAAGALKAFQAAAVLNAFPEKIGTPEADALLKDIPDTYKGVFDEAMTKLGSTGVKPSGLIEGTTAAIARGATSPETFILPAGRAIGALSPLAKAGMKSLIGGAAGGGSYVGMKAGGAAGNVVGEAVGGESGGQIGETIGSVGGALVGGALAPTFSKGGSNLTTAAVQKVAPAAYDKAKSVITEFRTGLSDVEQAKKASSAVGNIFEAAIIHDPKFADKVAESMRVQKETGIKMPINVFVQNNPVLASWVDRLVKSDPGFKAAYGAEWAEAKKQLATKTTRMFGSPTEANKAILSPGGVSDVNVAKAIDTRAKYYDRKISEQSRRVKVFSEREIGDTTGKLVEAAHKNAISAAAPLYQNAFSISDKLGLRLTIDDIDDVYSYAVGKEAGDIFKTHPEIYKKVLRLWNTESARVQPKKMLILDSRGNSIDVPNTGGASVQDLDSLKREVNSAIRKTSDATDLRLLGELKQRINGVIENLPPEFSTAYRAADDAYAKTVGIPFSEEGIKQINRARFEENVVPVITRNQSALQHLLDTTGDAGKKLADDAFTFKFERAAIDPQTGRVDPAKASKFMRDNRDALKLMPETKDRLAAISNDVQKLIMRRDELHGRVKQLAENSIVKAEGMTAQDTVSRMYSDPKFVDTYMRTHGNNPDTKRALQSFVLDDIIKSDKPLEFMADRTKKHAIDKLLAGSKQRATKIAAFADLAGRMKDDPSNAMLSKVAVDNDSVKKMIGMSPDSIVSLFFVNPVVSPVTAWTRLTQRFLNNKAANNLDEEMKRILLDDDRAQEMLTHMVRKVEKNGYDYKGAAQDAAALAKRTGINATQMLADDLIAGALRSSTGLGVTEEGQSMTEDEFHQMINEQEK